MPKIKIIIEYDGSNYSGWQIQNNSMTVQEKIEAALLRLTREKIRIYGASRTDAGVHARGQVAVFSTNSTIPPHKYAHAISSRLPRDITVKESCEVEDDFDPRYHAKMKLYRYSVFASRIRPAIGRQYCWHVKAPLNIEHIIEAAKLIEGEHDFTSFSNQECNTDDANNVRTVEGCKIIEEGKYLHFEVMGRSFLYNMVRNITGTLIDVGAGRFEVGDIPKIFKAKNRAEAGQGAPASGLCLEWIKYSEQ